MSGYQTHVFGLQAIHQHRFIEVLRHCAFELRSQMLDEEADPLAKLADKLEDCCRTPHVMVDEHTAEFALKEYRCKSRLCVRCGKDRANKLRAKLRPMVKEMDSPRLLTFTLVSSNDPLRDQLQRLTKCFAKLRRTKTWKAHFTAGFYCIEVTHNRRTDQWHPHIHAVCDGRFIAQKKLSGLWYKMTGDSNIVDVRMAHSKESAVRYVTKYVTKTQTAEYIPDHRIADWASSIKGLRFINTFGGLKSPPDELNDRESWEGYTSLTPLSVIEAKIRDGDPVAAKIWDAILYHASRGTPATSAGKNDPKAAERFALLQSLRTLLGDDPPETLTPQPQPPSTGDLFVPIESGDWF